MDPRFADAKQIPSLEAEICFLLRENFYYGPDSYSEILKGKDVEPLPSLNIPRQVPSQVRSTEVIGHERELANYYSEIIRIAKLHQKSFNEIRHYFWLRFWLWNANEKVTIGFPWYDTYSEIARFLDSTNQEMCGEVFWDGDQGWELSMHTSGEDFLIRVGDLETDETHEVVRFPKRVLLEQIEPLRARMGSIIRALSEEVGRDLWTKHLEWPEFCLEPRSAQPVRRSWWQRLVGRED